MPAKPRRITRQNRRGKGSPSQALSTNGMKSGIE